MLNKISHYALTNHNTVYDEEALSSLELAARNAAKINEAVEVINQQISIIESEISKFEDYANAAVDEAIDNGTITKKLSDIVWGDLKTSYDELSKRIDNLVTGSGDEALTLPEIVDARQGYKQTYDSIGQHLRAVANGNALSDAIRPGTVNAGRIMAGMFGGEVRDMYTIREIISLAGRWTDNGYVDSDTLEFVEHTGYSATNYIPCEYGDVFLIDTNIFGNKVRPAVVYDANLNVLDVLGAAGESNWDTVRSEVHVTKGNAAYIRFICGAGYQSTCRVYRVAMKQSPDTLAAEMARGYLHMHAKNRTDTVTDRAQIKCWFPLPESHSGNMPCRVFLQLHNAENVRGWTVRIFNATSGATYDEAANGSAVGYEYDPAYGLAINFTAAGATTEGTPVNHVAFFIDLIAENAGQYMDATLPKVTLYYGTNETPIQGVGYALHGALVTDSLNVVDPCAAASPLHKKRVLGLGDSLMRGNTLSIDKSWFNIMCGSVDADGYNAAVNGQSMSGTDSIASKVNTTLLNFPKPDYVIVQGGANDLRLSVPMATFRTALHTIVTALRTNNPRVKILFATNWQRSSYVNSQNLKESDYVEAMLEEAEAMNIPCVNNYADSLNLTDPVTAAWADEGIATGGEANIHFSVEANRYLAPAFRKELEGV